MPQVHRKTIVPRGKSVAEGVWMSLSSEIYEQVGYVSSYERKGREKGIRERGLQGIPRVMTEGQ